MFRRLMTACATLLLIAAAASTPTVALPQTDRTSPDPTVPTCIYLGPNYTPRQHWSLNAPMPTARFAFAALAPNGLANAYAIGGLQNWADALAVNERFNACSNTWETLAPMPAPRGYIQAAELNGRLYVVGGVDHVISGTFGVQSSTWIYDPAHNWWSVAAELPQALGGVALAAANGKLYAFGGFDLRGPGVGDVNTVYEYDPARDRWKLHSTLPGGTRSMAGAATFNGEIYVVGGLSGSEYGVPRNEIYNPIARTWRSATGIEYYGFTLVTAPDGYLYALGGSHDHDNDWITTQRYDPAADVWTYLNVDIDYNDTNNHGLGSGVYAAGRVFIIGGEGTPYNGYPNYTRFNNVVESLRVADSLCESSLQATPDAVTAGNYITYTLELHGEITPLPNVIVVDPIPGGTTFDGFITNPVSATFNASANQVEWNGPLAASPAPITLTFRVAVSDTSWIDSRFITNTVSIHNGLNVITRAVGTWYEGFDLSSSRKEVNRASAVLGDVITYSLRVQTTSPTSGAITLIDPLPAHTRYLTDSLSATSGTAAYANGVISWTGTMTPHTGIYTNTTNDYQWGDSKGNGVVPGVKYNWIEIEQTGRPFAFNSVDNDGCYHAAFPFPFAYYGQYYTQAAISTNGTLYFPPFYNGVLYRMSPDNTPIPGVNSYFGYSFGRFMAPFWDDLYLPPGWIYYQVVGEAPHRQIVYEFAHVSRRDGAALPGDTGTFEMIIFEDSNAILMQYKDVDFGNAAFDHGASATVGLQDSPELGTQYSYNEPTIEDRLAILYVPPQRAITYTANFADVTFAVTPDSVLPDRTPITNTATLTSSLGQTLTREAVTLYGAPNFSTSYKTVDHSIVVPADSPLYAVHVINTGPVDGLVTLTDHVLDEPYIYFWFSSLNYPYGLGHEYNYGVDWTGVVPAHSEAVIHYGVYVNTNVTQGQTFTNTALITDVLSNLVYQPSTTIVVNKPADLYVNSIGPGAITPSAPLTYTLNIGNRGPYDTEEPIVVTDVLPDGVLLASMSAGGVYSWTLDAITWSIDPLMVDATRTLTITVIAPAAPMGAVLTNTASVHIATQDPNDENNTQVWMTRLGDVPNLMNGTQKTVSQVDVTSGNVATYTISILNSGTLTATATITDPLPADVSFVAGSSTLDDVSIDLYDVGSNQIRWTGPIGPDQTIEVQFKTQAVAFNHTVTNTVSINDGAGQIIQRAARLDLPHGLFLPVILK